MVELPEMYGIDNDGDSTVGAHFIEGVAEMNV
ncbi:hypothetical protein ES704_03985 [subsurface metagenome]|jgi:hypothetical protein